MSEAAAFAPGHVTCFFEIHDEHPDPTRRGSRGAGFCLSQGVVSHVRLERREEGQGPDVQVWLDGAQGEAPVTTAAMLSMVGKSATRVEVRSQVQLPVGQGFGMSGAGALSAAMAMAKLLGRPRSDAVLAAHGAEVGERTGLGDVVAQWQGGVEVRREPGLPPWGSVQRVVGEGELVLCVLEGPLSTRSVLEDEGRRAAIRKAGQAAMRRFEEQMTLPQLFRAGKQFAIDSGLATEGVLRAIRAVERAGGLATQSMLGHSVVAYGDAERLEPALKEHGDVLRSSIEPTGARLVEVQRPA